MATTTTTLRRKGIPNVYNHWQKQRDVITHNDILKAFVKGKEAGKTEQQRVNQSLFDKNLEKAKAVCENIFQELSEANINLKAIHLKADAITNFYALFISKKEDFLKDDFRNAFIVARKYKNQIEDSTFFISFTFTPDSESLDENCLTSDGFFIKYNGEK